MRFLIADDLSSARKIIKKLLIEIGYTDIDEVPDGRQALDRVRAGGVDFVISDWNMPHMTGIDLLKELRADPQYAALPFLIVTASAKREDVIAAVQAGVSSYVCKPFDSKTLAQKIHEVLGPPKDGPSSPS